MPMNERERLGRQKTPCKIQRKIFNYKKPEDPQQVRFKKKGIGAICPVPPSRGPQLSKRNNN